MGPQTKVQRLLFGFATLCFNITEVKKDKQKHKEDILKNDHYLAGFSHSGFTGPDHLQSVLLIWRNKIDQCERHNH